MSIKECLKRKIVCTIVSGITMLWTTSGFCIFDAQLLVGMRNGKMSVIGDNKFVSKDVSGTSTKVAAHLDPIPLIPVSFGFFVSQEHYDVNKADHSMEELSGFTFGPEVNAWINLGAFQPYGRLSYAINALKGKVALAIAGEDHTADIVYSSTGTHVAGGIAWAPLPLPFKVLAEVSMGFETAKNDDFKINGLELKENSEEFSTTTYLVGAELGL